MNHAGSIASDVGAANVKAGPASDTAMAAWSASALSIPQLIDEEVNAWIDRERGAHAGVTRPMLLSQLARRLDLQNERQIYRYMSGETPFPLEKLIPFCCAVGSWKLLDVVRVAGDHRPRPRRLETFDMIVAQSTNLTEFGELVAAYAQASNAPASPEVLARLEREALESIRQIQLLLDIYRSTIPGATS